MFPSVPVERFEPLEMNISFGTVQLYCLACNIAPERQVHLFLANIGHELYSQLKYIFEPVRLHEQSFSAIKSKLTKHFMPKANVFVERYKFSHVIERTTIYF